MKKLNELYDCQYDTLIKGIKTNSKEIKPGDLFVCTKGVNTDRHNFIKEAISNGASALIVSKDVDVDIPYIKVENTNEELWPLCQRFYDNPDKKLSLIGITGTDGKTSVATIIQTLIGKDICGYIGTNGRSCSKFDEAIDNTTPDADKLYEYFSDFVNAGCKYATLETSSEAFFRKRLEPFTFNYSVYTNITSEHLNTHKTLENYIECKSNLFKKTSKEGACILNKDDEHFEEIKKSCNAQVYTYGQCEDNDFQIVWMKIYPDKTIFKIKYEDKEKEIISPLLGDFNVYNLSAALLLCLKMGFEFEYLINNIPKIKISGRLDMINLGQDFYVMIDYAHTPNGISKLLNFVHTLDINKSIVVIGQAGERDRFKRPIVGETVVKNATHAIFTYEDPRSEDPRDIINDMIANIKDYNNYEIVIDRHDAIKKAINIAQPKDIVLILGKGNENDEKLKTGTIYFNDTEEAIKALKERLAIKQ
ncbi:MAG: UDP-N-acetylmuramoyl-L-alanyl-D-glutamate--2,6-diaminopimelate ligase [Bacilli bacterium]|nr:UDP-N-acetylmuramoyl-L-alanyl-D-glutamate--2,6-diaminopimelate ligase [Bacilli bacterium]MDD4733734.1 UDP-N-acetylmuramoyl-L-alanyl-D-glutamate--2,6-diaminopimelate ligase [Bacilli bacterium]